MLTKKVILMHDIAELREIIETELKVHTGYIYHTGLTMDDCVAWIISEEVEKIFNFCVSNHNPKLGNYRHVYYMLINAMQQSRLAAIIKYSVLLPNFFCKNNEVHLVYTKHDIIATFDVPYTKTLV